MDNDIVVVVVEYGIIREPNTSLLLLLSTL